MAKASSVIRKFVHLYNYIDEYVILPTWGTVGRLIFGNNAGIFNNLFPKLVLNQCQRASNLNTLRDKVDQQLYRDGYIPLKGEFDQELLKKIKTKLENLFESPDQYVAAGHPPHQQAHRMLKDPLNQVPELKELFTDQINSLITNYYGSHYLVENIRCWRNLSVDIEDQKTNVFSNQWHNDQFNTNLMKYFVYLNEKVSEDTGAFRVHSIGNTKKIMRSLGYIRRSIIFGKAKKMINSPLIHEVIEGRLGDGFIFNPTVCLHRAGIPKRGTYRDVIQFEFKPAERNGNTINPKNFKKDSFLN